MVQRFRPWLPTLSLSFAAFIFITSEFMPIGILTEIASRFSKSHAQTGLLITVYAWVVALISIPLTMGAARINRRPLMLTLFGIFVIGQALCVLSVNFEMLLLSRLVIACAHAIFWSVVIPLAIRFAPADKGQHAMAIIATGATLGTVLGVPLGTLLVQLAGWRFSFAAMGFCALIIELILYRVLPSAPSRNAGGFRSIRALLHRRTLMLCYLMTAIFMTGHFALYTYISPFLQTVGGLQKELVATVLLVFGCAGMVGSFIAPRLLMGYLKPSAYASIFVVALCLAAIRLAAPSYPATLVLMFIWSMGCMIFGLLVQHLVLAFAPEAADVAMAGNSAIFNVGIGTGALIGGLFADHHLASLGLVGAGFLGLALVTCMMLLGEPLGVPRPQSQQPDQ